MIPYRLSFKNGSLVVIKDSNGEICHTVMGSEGYENCKWILADGFWIYGIRSEKELFRVDYSGEKYESLFIDGIHTIPVTGPFRLADHRVLFFQICSADQEMSLCRLYIPDLTTDILADHLDGELAGILPITSREVTWVVENPEFPDLVETKIADPDSQYYGMSREAASGLISAEYGVPIKYCYYANVATGEMYSMGYYGGAYKPRSSENIARNGDAWWKDFQ